LHHYQLIVNLKMNFYFGIAVVITHYAAAVSMQMQSVLLILQCRLIVAF